MKGVLRAKPLLSQSPRSIAVRIMMVRRQEGGELSSCSYLDQYDATQRSDRHRDSQEHRIQSGRSRVISVFSCGEADGRAYLARVEGRTRDSA